jgi:tetratricopeptide (TPR) repeat protein
MTTADAYNLYLAARQIARTRTEPELKRAYALARKVVQGQPNFAPGQALFAELTWMLSDGGDSYGSIPAEQARRIAMPHARKAIALAPNAPDGYAALGLIQSAGEGIPHLQHAMKLDPARSELPLWTALELNYINRFKDALVHLERAAAIDPLWPAAVSRLAVDLTGVGHADRAKQVINAYERRGGELAQVARMRATVASMSGDLSELVRWGRRGLKLNPTLPYVPRYLERAYMLLGLPLEQGAEPKGQQLAYRFYHKGVDTVAGEPLTAALWDSASVDFLVYAAGARRDWPRLAALYALDRNAARKLCFESQFMAGNFILALRQTGHGEEAQKLLDCVLRQAANIQYGGPRLTGAIAQAEIQAIAGDKQAAFRLLDNAMRFGWTGKTARLTDMPALDTLATHPRYAALQRQLDEWIARERRETVALLMDRKAA